VDSLGDRLENILTGQISQDVRDLKARLMVVEEKLGSPAAHENPTRYGDKK
jgi:hypothetical protein